MKHLSTARFLPRERTLTLEPVSDVVYLLKKAEMEGALEKKAVLHALVCAPSGTDTCG